MKKPRKNQLLQYRPSPLMDRTLTKARTTDGSHDSSAGFIRLWLLTTAIQLALVSWTYPIGELLSDKPLTYIDHPVHLHRIILAAEMAEQGFMTGYDPFFAAGSPAGMPWNPAAKVPAFLAIAGLEPVLAWKIYTFVAAVVAPGLLIIAARLLSVSLPIASWMGILGGILWWASMFRWFHTAGLVSFVLASYLAIPYLAYFRNLIKSPRILPKTILISLAGGIATLVHPLFPVIVVLPGLIMLWTERTHLNPLRYVTILMVIPAIVLLMNWFWFYPTFFQKIYSQPDFGVHQSLIDPWMILWEALAIWRGEYHGARVYPLILLGTLLAIRYHRGTAESFHKILPFILGGFLLIIYAATGSSIDRLAGLTQPNRFAVTGYLMLTVAAASAMVTIPKLLRKYGIKWEPALYGAALMVLVLINLNEVRRELSKSENIGHYGKVPPEVTGYGEKYQYLLHWLHENTDASARVLFETSHARIHDRGHIAGMLSYESKREFIGGPYVLQHYAGFWDHTLFARDIREFTPQELEDRMRMYNIGWVIAHHPITKSVLDGLSFVEKKDEFSGISIYRTTTSNGFILEGKGQILRRELNRLVLGNLEGDRILLSYHLIPGMECLRECDMRPYFFEDDPVPFIELVSPHPYVEIRWKGDHGIRNMRQGDSPERETSAPHR